MSNCIHIEGKTHILQADLKQRYNSFFKWKKKLFFYYDMFSGHPQFLRLQFVKIIGLAICQYMKDPCCIFIPSYSVVCEHMGIY